MKTLSSPILDNPEGTTGSARGDAFMGNRHPKPREHSRIRWPTAAAFPWSFLSNISR